MPSAVLRIFFIAILTVAPLLLPTPGQAQTAVQFPHSRLEVVGTDGTRHGFAVELAAAPAQWEQGLMFRRHLDGDAGMLFDFGTVRPIAMWMKNTLIPLDMLFIAADGRIAGIAERALPQSTATISSPGPVRAVLELNGGTASRLGLRVGDRIVHPLFSPP